jgi:hypothetical protein
MNGHVTRLSAPCCPTEGACRWKGDRCRNLPVRRGVRSGHRDLDPDGRHDQHSSWPTTSDTVERRASSRQRWVHDRPAIGRDLRPDDRNLGRHRAAGRGARRRANGGLASGWPCPQRRRTADRRELFDPTTGIWTASGSLGASYLDACVRSPARRTRLRGRRRPQPRRMFTISGRPVDGPRRIEGTVGPVRLAPGRRQVVVTCIHRPSGPSCTTQPPKRLARRLGDLADRQEPGAGSPVMVVMRPETPAARGRGGNVSTKPTTVAP